MAWGANLFRNSKFNRLYVYAKSRLVIGRAGIWEWMGYMQDNTYASE